MTPEDKRNRHGAESSGTPDRTVPEDPALCPTETVEALESGMAGEDVTAPDADGWARGEDVSENPPDEEMEGLPGPSGSRPQESSG